ncbi:MAG: LysE family transporter [Polaromonas sp.]|nr:LysE family transporter [Polaromonas sp.]
MDLHTWTAYFLAATLIAISPGSGAILAMSHGLNYGVRRTHATIAGLQAGLLVILLVAGAGVGSLLVASELAFSVVKTLGAAYLIYLGWSQWRSTSTLTPEAGTPADADVLPAGRRWLSGFLTNVTNPKGIVFMVAVLPQFISPGRPLWLQLLVIALTTLAVDTIVMHGYAFAASRLQTLFKNAQAIQLQNRVFGGLLMAVGTGLFFVKRSQQVAQPI